MFARTVQPLWQEIKKTACLSICCCPWSQPFLKNTARQISGKVVGTPKDEHCHLLHHLQDKDQLWGTYLLAPGPAGVKGRFVREIMLLLDGISVGRQITIERERVHPCNVCDKDFKSLQMPSQHKIWQHSGYTFAWKGCGKTFNPNSSINRYNKLLCGEPHHRKSFCPFSIWGNDHHWGDHPSSERAGGGGGEKAGYGQLLEEGRHPLPSKI